MALNSKDAIDILESVVGRVGNDEEIESVTADLIGLKDYLLTVDATIDTLNEELAKVNEKNRGLLQSNNTLYRQIGHQQDAMKRATEEVSNVDMITQLFQHKGEEKMNTPKIDWYGRDELRSLKETAQPETVAEVLPNVTPVAQEVPEYPVTDLTADEVETVEISEDDNKKTEEGTL